MASHVLVGQRRVELAPGISGLATPDMTAAISRPGPTPPPTVSMSSRQRRAHRDLGDARVHACRR